jgi:hypothetical protein
LKDSTQHETSILDALCSSVSDQTPAARVVGGSDERNASALPVRICSLDALGPTPTKVNLDRLAAPLAAKPRPKLQSAKPAGHWVQVNHWVKHCTPYGYCVVENHPTWEWVTR